MKISITAQLTDLGADDPVTLMRAEKACKDFDSSVSLDEILSWISTVTSENPINVLNHCEFFVESDEMLF